MTYIYDCIVFIPLLSSLLDPLWPPHPCLWPTCLWLYLCCLLSLTPCDLPTPVYDLHVYNFTFVVFLLWPPVTSPPLFMTYMYIVVPFLSSFLDPLRSDPILCRSEVDVESLEESSLDLLFLKAPLYHSYTTDISLLCLISILIVFIIRDSCIKMHVIKFGSFITEDCILKTKTSILQY